MSGNKRDAAYSSLADWFEYLNDDCGYLKWAERIYKKIEDRYPVSSCGVDIGCGSGYFTRFLKKKGYNMLGMDISVEMLTKAEDICARERSAVPFVVGDITSFKLIDKVDFAIAVNDCINYVKKDKLAAAFKCVHRCLKKGGSFLFDISPDSKLFLRAENGVEVDDRDDITYMSFNSLSYDTITMDVSLFIKGADGLYERKDERHTLYVYTTDDIIGALTAAGFGIEEISENKKNDGTTDRIEFIASK